MKSDRRTQSTTMAIEHPSPISRAYNRENTGEEGAACAFENNEWEAGLHGSDLEHWLAAEAGLLAEQSI